MKKLLLMLLIGIESITVGCNLCLGQKGRWLRKRAIESVECSCECEKYLRSTHEDGYQCLKCHHTIKPYDIEYSGTNFVPHKPKIINHWKKNRLKTIHLPKKESRKILIDSIEEKTERSF